MDLVDLATRLVGNRTDWRAELDTRLQILRSDIADDTTEISDDHPRFPDHLVLLTWACETWPTVDLALDEATRASDANAATNKLTRDLIDQIRADM